MPGFHHSVAVSPLPLRKKFRKNYVAYVKNSVAPLPFQLPLRRNRCSVANRIESHFCRSAVAGQPISVLVTSSLRVRKDVSSNSVLTRNSNCSYTERNYGNGTTERRNGNGSTATEWWKLGISQRLAVTQDRAPVFSAVLIVHKKRN